MYACTDGFVKHHTPDLRMVYMWTAIHGLSLLIAFPVIISFFHFTGIEKFELPKTFFTYMIQFSNVFFMMTNSLGQYVGLWATSPVFIAVGTVLSIPFSAVLDYFMHG